ncbi:MAG TPA: ParA family protein [Albitalea sp.]|uniref:ParA family protein n=1 Tax=Piscinibacter sp. TaxID=1903157 RepID=UPI002ED6BD70
MRTLVVANHKGGVGKTAVASLITHHLVATGRRVLAIDLDHQGNFTKPLRLCGLAILADVTADRLLAGRAQVPQGNLVVVGASSDLLGLESRPERHNSFATHFRDFLHEQSAKFDVCVVDTNPNPDIRLISALVSCDLVVMPIQLNQEAIDGIGALLDHPRVGVKKVKAVLNPKLQLIGILPNMVEPTPFQRDNFKQIVEHHASLLIPLDPARRQFACIPKRSAIAEAQSAGSLLWQMKKTAARDAWREIEPTIAGIANIVTESTAPHGA